MQQDLSFVLALGDIVTNQKTFLKQKSQLYSQRLQKSKTLITGIVLNMTKYVN